VDNANQKDSLLNEIRGAIQAEGPEFTKFLNMVASFSDDIPEEYKRYRAAIKAIKQSSGIDQYDLLKAADRQLMKLTQTETMMSSSLEGKRADLKQFILRSREINDKLNILKKQVDELEKERTIISDRRATKEAEIAVVEDSYKSVAGKLGKEIGLVKEKIQKYLSEDYKGEPLMGALVDNEPLAAHIESFTANPMDDMAGAPAVETDFGASGLGSPLDSQEDQVSSPMGGGERAASSTRQKVCPDCSGTMDWYAMMKMWKCYSCGHEEKVKKK